jgi:hypothetical protein
LESAQADVEVPYQIDGDVAGVLPVKVWVDRQELLVRVPRKN